MSSDYDIEKILELASEMYNMKRYSSSAYLAYVALTEFEKLGDESGVEYSLVILQFSLNGIERYAENRMNSKPAHIKAIKIIKKILESGNYNNLSKVLNDVCGRDSSLEELVDSSVGGKSFSFN